MTRDDSPRKEVAMDTTNNVNHTAPLATFSTTPIDEEMECEASGDTKKGGTFPRMARFCIPETPPDSQNGTLKANEGHRPQRHNGSLKGPWNRRNKERGIPAVKADTARVLEMYLKRRSKSLNDAVLTREYFAQEKKKIRRAARNNTISVCSTISTDSTTSEAHVTTQVTVETTSDVDRTVFSREKGTQQSFHEAMKCPIMEDSSTMERSADDELSSSDETSPRSRSAPSTLRMQVHRDSKEDMDTLRSKDRENGTATLTRDGYKRDSKKEPKRKRSFLEKAKQKIRSPSTSRKIVRTPSATQRHEDKEKDKERERIKEEKERSKQREKERERQEKEREKERLRKEKEDKERLEKRLKEEKEKLKEREKELEREEVERHAHARRHARNEVHSEMKKTGFTARLKQTFRRSSREKHREKDHTKTKGNELPIRSEPHPHKDVKSKRWPSFQFRRKSRKSASTPTDESGACATTPSDTASMDFEYFSTRPDHTRSLNDAERRRLLVEMRRGGTCETSGNASDSQLLDLAQGGHPLLAQAMSNDSFGSFASFASSEGSEQRPERPRTLAFRRTRAERAQRGLNDVIRLEDMTPGHVRRDVNTAAPVFSGPLALAATDLVSDGRVDDQGQRGSGAEGDDRNMTDSWTESGDGSDIPFEQRNQAEQEQYFKRIADRLALIGDQALADYNFNEASGQTSDRQQRITQSTCYAEATATCSASVSTSQGASVIRQEYASEYAAIGERIRTDVDGIQTRRQSMARFPAGMVMGVVFNDTYQTFYDAMQTIVGQEVGWEQLAIVFKFTKVAVKAAHSMGKRAGGIKDNSIRFIGDQFAVWLSSQGGYKEMEGEEEMKETDV